MSSSRIAPAACLQASLTKPPLLSPGEISPETLASWEDATRGWIAHKEVAEDKQVSLASYGFQDPRIRAWLRTHAATHNTLSFTAFMTIFRANWLPRNWESRLSNALLNSRQGLGSFWDWQVDLHHKNALLTGTNSHLDDNALRRKLKSGVTPELAAALSRREQQLELLSFTDWIEYVRDLDDRRLDHAARVTQEATKLQQRAELRSGAPARNNSRATVPSFSAIPTLAPSTATMRRSAPKLTDIERKLLSDHEGCFKCRQFYAGHRSAACPNGFPDGDSYHTLTEQQARSTAKARTPIVASADCPIVASIVPCSIEPSTIIDEQDNYEVQYVPSLPPLRSDSLVWRCRLDGPATLGLIHDALIDDGAQVVLIRESLARETGLLFRKLHTPVSLGQAFAETPASPSPVLATHWIKLSLSSLDMTYVSRTVRALVAPDSLAYALILGLPFLSHNHLVIDPSLRSVIDKDSAYDLLAPITVPKPYIRPYRSPKATRIQTCEQLRAVQSQLKTHIAHRRDPAHETSTLPAHAFATAVRARIASLACEQTLAHKDSEFKTRYADLFPDDIPHVDQLPTDIVHRIRLKDPEKLPRKRSYSFSRKYQEEWKTLLKLHEDAGRIRPSSSPFASPAFLIPKADPNALPRWVNDYRELNANTVPDSHPLSKISVILADCARGKIWAKLDMTNSFFQTRMHPDDIPYTAVLTPFGLYEWVVMPMGGRNAPATHQRRMCIALREYIGKICHVYLDDIIIWSQDLAEHERNVALVLNALKAAHLFCSPKKTQLFCTSLTFLGHHISADGLAADTSKVQRILDWPAPKSASDVRSFLGLVRYVADFLPALAEHTAQLTPLTTKDAEKVWPEWTAAHNRAFEAIKKLVLSRQCLTTIDHDNPGKNRIYVTCDASNRRTGACLSYGPSWETARPVAFDSMQFTSAQSHYPTHEQELLAIVRALS